jgi:tRNA1(Val) A37 N6-methylase TrmN6
MTIAITLLLASLLIIGILRNTWNSREESSAEQVTESPAEAEKISEPQAEIIIENPPHQAPAQKKTAPAKKTPAKSAPAKKTTSKK